MTRVAIIGTDSSHARGICEYLNHARQPGRARVTALCGADPGRTAELAAAFDVPHVVDRPEQLSGLVDAAIVCDRDGRRHRGSAEPLLHLRIPLLVDKPFTCSTADASALVALAAATGTLLTSYSPLRFAPEVLELQRISPRHPDEVRVSGPADPASPYGGLHFYGSHHADILAALVPGRPRVRRVAATAAGLDAHLDVGRTRATLHFAGPGNPAEGFSVEVKAGDVTARRPLHIGPTYLWPGLGVFFDMLTSGRPPVAGPSLLDPVAVLEDIIAVAQAVAPLDP